MPKYHVIPKTIKDEVETALNYYPQLKNIHIEFKFKKNIKKSTMQARPTFDSFFKLKKNRKFLILISEKFKISDKEFSTRDIPKDIFIGWIGHELGHIMDYQNRSKLNLIWFGLKYLFSDNHIVEAERAADGFAVKHKMESYIIKTKNFILNHADISEAYKNRIKRYYLSPEEIMVLVDDRNKLEENLENIK
ncbi:hypothetical protein QWY81_06870 [Polaribacter undariae]|uniref:Uncharacterized protein n=1 Tax=Polaribacter sejongensis TaxID=985043 RepID=A0AAJ1QVY6_9FLAO|nr:hypothetical protein [Polaribacter undariae]MDN3619176.1 hypothetical protein [Polaribacter undariae]UWD33623.1 hypothetical protein NQP51_08100 [Polaribacter undariae]